CLRTTTTSPSLSKLCTVAHASTTRNTSNTKSPNRAFGMKWPRRSPAFKTGSMPALDGGACATFTSASARSSKMFLAVLRQRKPASFGHTFRRCCGWTITLPLAK
ncbi:hypothetical protein AAVH_41756, partial [Aphelenchoides avenae]